MFGMRYGHRATWSTPTRPQPTPPDETSLPLIGTVSTERPEYQVTLLDTPSTDSPMTYHLRLEPLEHPKVNRLRQLWVGTDDYLPRRAIIAGDFTTAPLVDVPWTVDFSVINGAPYIARERALNTLYLVHQRVVHDAIVAFEDIREPDNTIYDTPLVEPEWAYSILVEPAQ
jgi:hypothetical protein